VKTLFNYITAFSAVILITTILLQSRGSSLGAGFGSDNTFYRSKRGAELVLYYVIFVVAIILSILSKR
jgi:protein translocase SecG subunit